MPVQSETNIIHYATSLVETSTCVAHAGCLQVNFDSPGNMRCAIFPHRFKPACRLPVHLEGVRCTKLISSFNLIPNPLHWRMMFFYAITVIIQYHLNHNMACSHDQSWTVTANLRANRFAVSNIRACKCNVTLVRRLLT